MPLIWSKTLEITLGNLRKNLQSIKRLLPEEVAILPVIKNDAYGHGLLEVAKVLAEEKVWGFGLSEPEEGLILRKAGFIHPIILLSGFEKDWLPEMVHLRLTPVVTSLDSFFILKEFCLRKGISVEFHLKAETGMNRFGLPFEDLQILIKELRENSYLKLVGLMTHLSASEDPDSSYTQAQLENFKKFLKVLQTEGFAPKYIHFCNSGGIIFLPEKGNLVRPGIALYGGYPSFRARAFLKLYPVMSLKSRIVEIKRLKPGEGAGYGPTFIAKRETRLGIVPVGYGDGYPRALSNRGFAYCLGTRVPIMGTISMKALYIDLTDLAHAKVGDEVILLGGPNNEVPADELAQLAGTICYELFCQLGRAIPRTYKD